MATMKHGNVSTQITTGRPAGKENTMKYFQNITTLEELKKAYHRLALKYHPDCGGDTEIMKAINQEHDELFNELKARVNAKADELHQTTEAPEEFRDIIDLLLRMRGLSVELCGSWLWIGGDTLAHKDKLKAAGCRWAPKKGLWSWHHVEDTRTYYRGKRTMNEIRGRYGSRAFTTTGDRAEYYEIGAAC